MESRNVALKRTLASVQDELNKGKAGFLLGAGVDILIASDFTKLNERLPPNWAQLICGLQPFSRIRLTSARRKTVEHVVQNWPTEAASVVHWWEGDRNFQHSIQTQLDQPRVIQRLKGGIPHGSATYELCRLLLKSNLILTSNYSSYVVQALRSFNPSANIAVIDREDLPSLRFPDGEKNPSTIFVIHLHGRCSARSFPVLDAWGYNVLQHDDDHYLELLRRFFTDRAVITIGLSWSDPPLRSAAAYVQRTRPYLSKRHVAVYFLSHNEKRMFASAATNPDPQGVARLWGDAMRAAYGVDVLFVDRVSQVKALHELASEQFSQRQLGIQQIRQDIYDAENDTDKLVLVWNRLAEFLDSCGDYESPLHHRLLRILAGVDYPTSEAVAEATHKLADDLVRFLQLSIQASGRKLLKAEHWLVAARIERHLRHHLYLYRLRQDSNTRQEIWHLLWKHLPGAEWKMVPHQLRFDFLVGKFRTEVATHKYEQALH